MPGHVAMDDHGLGLYSDRSLRLAAVRVLRSESPLPALIVNRCTCETRVPDRPQRDWQQSSNAFEAAYDTGSIANIPGSP